MASASRLSTKWGSWRLTRWLHVYTTSLTVETIVQPGQVTADSWLLAYYWGDWVHTQPLPWLMLTESVSPHWHSHSRGSLEFITTCSSQSVVENSSTSSKQGLQPADKTEQQQQHVLSFTLAWKYAPNDHVTTMITWSQLNRRGEQPVLKGLL